MRFKINGSLTVDNILKEVDPLRLFKFYCNAFNKPGIKFSARELRDDPLPSAIIDYHNGTYLYKDFGEDGALNCFQYIGRKFNISFYEVLKKINEDFNLELGEADSFVSSKPSKAATFEKKDVYDFKTILKIKKRAFLEHDLIWWGQQSWTLDMLNPAKIHPITHFRLTSERKNIHELLYIADDYSYSMDYYWHKGIYRRKLYFPKKQSHLKWLSNVNSTIVQGWDLLPKRGEICFITSSFKDTGPFWRLHRCPVSVAPNNEGSFIPEHVLRKIKQRFKYVVIWFDNDEIGIRKAMEFSERYKIPFFHNPLRSPKDPAAFWKNEGGRSFNNLIEVCKTKILKI